MLSFSVNRHLHSANAFRIRTYKSAPSHPLCHQHLREPLASVASTALTTPLDAALTQSPAPNSFIGNTYKNTGEGAHHPGPSPNRTGALSVAGCLASPAPTHPPCITRSPPTSPIRLLSPRITEHGSRVTSSLFSFLVLPRSLCDNVSLASTKRRG